MWDAAVYRRFGSERSRPFFDLVGRIGDAGPEAVAGRIGDVGPEAVAGRAVASGPRAVVDLGCGPGELTATLAERWPGARITGVDSSPEMIAKATEMVADGTKTPAGPVSFELGDVRDWRPTPETDVLVTNAALQWVPEHRDLLARWARELPPGAWLAMQVPGNFGAPSHVLLRAVGQRYGLGDLLREAPVDDPAGYAALLTAAGATVDAWETTYLHLLPADGPDHPVLRWMEGTALRPVKAALDQNAWQAFRADLARELTGAYPATGEYVAFPFRRVFVVARTADPEGTTR
ncbi:methyltransferase domain-containing protein [Actinoplanes solisilvae]|uniref:methyltransferase domain-containing protein n=1 Tax=Actinoplanes solisilvae TaxID=2486853 RepID=UPI000FD85AF6|nr:methyltransferase domain-containing protein [Actinoplanes solisilvae]